LSKGTVLVTGISGFTGPYVRHALERRGYRVVGLTNLHSAHPEDAAVDLLDEAALSALVERVPFDAVIHLAGVSFVAHGNAGDFYRSNLLGTLNLLEALSRSGRPMQKVVLASSANVYGRPARLPVDELCATAPVSDYGTSKLAMEQMARLWFGRLPILITRPFNYTGVGQAPKFVVAKVAEHFRTGREEIELGDVMVTREFMDVRDVAQIYVRLVESNAAGEVVNICSGRGHTVKAVIDCFSALSGKTLRIRSKGELQRANDIPELVGSPSKLNDLLSGQVRFRAFEETAAWMLRDAPERSGAA
jgi:nucleoside-diphosphate-sugar epimerase